MLNKIVNYLKEIWGEMRKVAWPSRNELVNSTIVVIVISTIVAVIIFVLDTIFARGLGIIIK